MQDNTDGADPSWLLGHVASPSYVQRWVDETDRQFCVLPFYENNNTLPGDERYMLWGRALSDKRFYPVPFAWYSLDLVRVPRRFRDAGDRRDHPLRTTPHYRWVAQVELHQAHDGYGAPRMELNTYDQLDEALVGIGVAALAIGQRDIVTPEQRAELVSYGNATAESPCTAFYPDCSLFHAAPRPIEPQFITNERAWRSRLGMGPTQVPARPREGWHAPVEVCWRATQVLGARTVSTEKWDLYPH
jgi:hypothetical protein